MTLKAIALLGACTLSLLPLTATVPPVAAQTRTPSQANPQTSSQKQTDFDQLRQAIYQWVVDDFRRTHRSLQGARIEISDLVISGDWATGIWLLTSPTYAEGIASQALMRKQGQRWVYVDGAGGMFAESDFIRLGVPPANAAGLAAGSDL